MLESVSVERVLGAPSVIAVVTIDDAGHAAPLAAALVAGGIRAIEVTLRTAAALEAISAMRAVEKAVVGAGTVLDANDLSRAILAGARFAVSPGFTAELARAAGPSRFAWIPGVATASEVMRARDAGFRLLKFFPAESSGAEARLRGFADVFRDVRFCPTGGITMRNAARYLALPNVACVGGSWLARPEAQRAGDWAAIRRFAREAAALRR